MANPSFQIDDELLEQFDDILLQMKAHGEIPKDTNRSDLLRNYVKDFVEENEEYLPEE